MAPEPKASLRVYVWDRCLMLQAESFLLNRRPKPHKRLSATIIVANKNPFVMEFKGHPPQTYQGVIIAPNVPRLALQAKDSELTLLDVGIATEKYRALEPRLAREQARALSTEELDRIRPLLTDSFPDELNCAQATRLFDEVIRRLAGTDNIERNALDPRILRVMRLVEDLPLDELSLPLLARAAELSESRLRVLFQDNLRCGPAQYMRWVNAWKAIRLWEKGKKFTEVAHEMGFHDLAHIDHAVSELFGISPSAVTIAQGVSFHKCGS